MTENKKGWYVLRAISGKEAQVKEIIEGSMKRSDLGKFCLSGIDTHRKGDDTPQRQKGNQGKEPLFRLRFYRSHSHRRSHTRTH